MEGPDEDSQTMEKKPQKFIRQTSSEKQQESYSTEDINYLPH
jgi:hypothetical protein